MEVDQLKIKPCICRSDIKLKREKEKKAWKEFIEKFKQNILY